MGSTLWTTSDVRLSDVRGRAVPSYGSRPAWAPKLLRDNSIQENSTPADLVSLITLRLILPSRDDQGLNT